jgi:glycosyltransferase involved in cell wall biosynthesis
MKKLKILYICDRGYMLGGAGIILLAKVDGLKKRGHEVKIFTSDFNPTNSTLFSDYTFKGFDERSAAKWFNQIFNFRSYLRLREVLQEYRPDIIHLHDIFYQVSPSILLAAGDIPVILTLHSYELICPTGASVKPDGSRCVSPGKHDLRCTGSVKGYVYEVIKQYVHKLLLKKVLLYITPSESMSLDFTGQKIIQAPIKVIYHGITLSEYKPLINFNRILYVGRLSKEKGVKILVRAFKIISNIFPDIYLDIVGDGPELNDLRILCGTLDIKDRVIFHGQVDKKDVMDFYVKSTFVVVPSVCSEAFSLSGVEALSVGRPVIGSNIGAIPEWLVDNKCGLLFKPGDFVDLASKAMVILGSESVLKDMSVFGHGYSQKFSADASVNSLENLYFELINKGQLY